MDLTPEQIAEKIKRRRFQILVHSCLYYGLDINLVSDATFDTWEHELVELTEKYPDIAATVEWADGFKNFDGSSGAFLPYSDLRIVNIARKLLDTCNKDTDK